MVRKYVSGLDNLIVIYKLSVGQPNAKNVLQTILDKQIIALYDDSVPKDMTILFTKSKKKPCPSGQGFRNTVRMRLFAALVVVGMLMADATR